MVKDFIEMERETRNMAIAWIIVYFAAVVILMVFGNGIAERATENVPLLSLEGFFKIDAMLLFLMLTAIVFIPGPLYVIDAIGQYARHRTS